MPEGNVQIDRVRMSDGAELATWTTWRTDGVAVLLVHGGPGLWDYLGPLVDLIDDAGVVHRYDQRGCGRSSASNDQTMLRYLSDIEELRRSWGHERLVLVGHSFGATLALAYAGTYPERAAAVAYVNGVGIGDWRAVSRVEETRRRRECGFEERLAELSQRSRTPGEEAEWRRLKWATDYADTGAGLEAARAMAETPLDINNGANRAVQFSDADVIGWAAGSTCPVFFLHGIADHRPVSHVMALAAKTPRARKRVIEGAGHLPWVERPGEVRELLSEVIRAAG